MAKCKDCGREMTKAAGCTVAGFRLKSGGVIARIKYGTGDGRGAIHGAKRCHDCNVKIGELHHQGCDMEECPLCHGQLISCSCKEWTGG
jgi:hypothetical protein